MAHIKLKSLLSSETKRIVKESYQRATGGLRLEHFINSPALSIDERYVFESYLEYRSFRRLNESVLLNEQTAILLERDLLSEGFFSWLADKASQAYTWVKAKVEDGWNAIKNMWENFKAFVKQICESVRKMFNWLWESIKTLGTKAYNSVKSALDKAADRVKEIVESNKDSFIKEVAYCKKAAVHVKEKISGIKSPEAAWYTATLEGKSPNDSAMDSGVKTESINVTLENIFNSDVSHILRKVNFINESEDGVVHPESILKKWPKLQAIVSYAIKIISYIFNFKNKLIQYVVSGGSKFILQVIGISIEKFLNGPVAPTFTVISTLIGEIVEIANGVKHLFHEDRGVNVNKTNINEDSTMETAALLTAESLKRVATTAISTVANWLLPWMPILGSIIDAVHIFCICYALVTVIATLGDSIANIAS